MKPIKIPDIIPGRRITIGGEDGTIPCEYLLRASVNDPSKPIFTAILEISEEEINSIRLGSNLVAFDMYGGEVPWSIQVVGVKAEKFENAEVLLRYSREAGEEE